MTPPSASDDRLTTGAAGEELVARHLEKQGFTIEARGARTRLGEIDIVARRGGLLCFCEVKTRRSRARGRGIAAVGWDKRRRMLLAAKAFAARHARGLGLRCRVDSAEVFFPHEGEPVVTYYENVVQDEGE